MEQNELDNLRILLNNKNTVELGLELAKNIDDLTFNQLLLNRKFVKLKDFYYHKPGNTWINYRFDNNAIQLTCDRSSIYFRFYINVKSNHAQLKGYLTQMLLDSYNRNING